MSSDQIRRPLGRRSLLGALDGAGALLARRERRPPDAPPLAVAAQSTPTPEWTPPPLPEPLPTPGGTIMGADPGTSVVNKYGQVWDMPNLFVVGASNYPQNGGYNPTGTAGALAFHMVDAIVTKYLPNPGMLT